MISYFKTKNNQILRTQLAEKGGWISVVSPTESDKTLLVNQFGIDKNFIETTLDRHERSHIKVRTDQTLVIFDIPISGSADDDNFHTMPIGFILTNDFVITVSRDRSEIIEKNILKDKTEEIDSSNKVAFMLKIMFEIVSYFENHLKYLDQAAFKSQIELKKNVTSSDLVRLLEIDKSLIYFTTSLKLTQNTLQKLLRNQIISPDDKVCLDMLDDLLIEVEQSIETAAIFSQVLSSTMDTVSSIISNRLNTIMKIQASLTIIVAIPSMIFGFYGMNVALPFVGSGIWTPMLLAISLSVYIGFMLYKKDYF